MDKERPRSVLHIADEIIEICKKHEVTYDELESVLMLLRKRGAECAKIQ